MSRKICIKCGEEKDYSEFSYRKDCNSYRGACKQCRKHEHHLYYFKNKNKHKEKNKEWRIKNKEKSQAIYARYRKTEKRKKIAREWAKAHRKQHRVYCNKKYKNDPYYNLVIKLRRRFYMALKTRHDGVRKLDKTINILGCSYLFFKGHIESQFSEEMTWDMVLSGKIHIDHIFPVSAFDLTKKEHQAACFNWRNMQPMFAQDNIAKRDKFNNDSLNDYLKLFIEK